MSSETAADVVSIVGAREEEERLAAEAAQAEEEAARDRTRRARALPDTVKVVGYNVSWSVRDALISRDDLRAALGAAGFGGFLPDAPPSPHKALRRAIAEWATSRTNNKTLFAADDDEARTTSRRPLIREVKGATEAGERGRPVVFALVEEASLGADLALRYGTAYRFRYRPATDGTAAQNGGTMTVVSTASGPIGDESAIEARAISAELLPIWERHKTYYSGADLAGILKAIILGLGAVSMEQGSGVWFMPARWADTLDRLEGLITGLPVRKGGVGCHCRAWEIIDLERTRAALRAAAEEQLIGEIAQAEADLAKTKGRSDTKPGSVKFSTVKGFIDRRKALEAKYAEFAEIAGLRQERLLADMSRLGDVALTIARTTRDRRVGPAVALPVLENTPRASRAGDDPGVWAATADGDAVRVG